MRSRGQRKFRGIRPGRPSFRSVPISAEMAEVVRSQIEAFRQKFGRPPGPEDPLFFNPDSEKPEFQTPQQQATNEAQIGDMMRRAGVAPAKVYAFEKTGLIATEKNWDLMRPEDRAAWNAAIEEYESIPQE